MNTSVKQYAQSIHTEICDVTVYASKNAITAIELCRYDAFVRKNEITEKCCCELNEYFEGKRKSFDVPLELHGSPFSVKVWQALSSIPYGETASYKEIAVKAGSPKAFRAVGNANHKNPIPIIIPCHRVVSADGSIGGYAYPSAIKEKLLALEKRNK